jgi:hypothetical protein
VSPGPSLELSYFMHRDRDYIPHVRGRGEEIAAKKLPGFRACGWVIVVSHS